MAMLPPLSWHSVEDADTRKLVTQRIFQMFVEYRPDDVRTQGEGFVRRLEDTIYRMAKSKMKEWSEGQPSATLNAAHSECVGGSTASPHGPGGMLHNHGAQGGILGRSQDMLNQGYARGCSQSARDLELNGKRLRASLCNVSNRFLWPVLGGQQAVSRESSAVSPFASTQGCFGPGVHAW
eukprot:gene2382-8690_t